MQSRKSIHSAFTLIELLIVVAIIAILAAIAVPNFLEAQTRAKVTRVKADMRSVGVAMEAYMIDNNTFPMSDLGDFVAPADDYYQTIRAWVCLSTPIVYIMSAKLIDPFRPAEMNADPPGFYQIGTGHSQDTSRSGFNLGFPRDCFVITSPGPDYKDATALSAYPFSCGMPYDPSNGTVSIGDLFLCGPSGKIPKGYRDGPSSIENLGEFVPKPF